MSVSAGIGWNGWTGARDDNATSSDLGEVFADIFGGSAEVVAERTSVACLTGTLAEELAGHMRGVCK